MNINFDSLKITYLLKIGKYILSILKNEKIFKYSLSI